MSHDLKNLPIVQSGLTDDSVVFGAKEGQSDSAPDPISVAALWEYTLSKVESDQQNLQDALGIAELAETAETSAAAAVAAAESAAASAASAAEVTGAIPRVNLTALKALDTAEITCAILTETGIEGLFFWKAGNYTSRIDDVNFIKADAVAASSGAWVREFIGFDIIEGTSNAVEINWIMAAPGYVFGGGNANTLAGGTPTQPNKLTGEQNLRTNHGGYDQDVEGLACSIYSSPHSSIGSSATHAQIRGGSTGSITNGDYSGISDGTNNQITSSGDANRLDGAIDGVISGGAYNRAGGYQPEVIGGNANFYHGHQLQGLSGSYGFGFGRSNTKTADYAGVIGYEGVARTVGGLTMSGGKLVTAGDAQATTLAGKGVTTSTSLAVISSADNSQTIAVNSDNVSWVVHAILIARRISDGKTASYQAFATFERTNGTTRQVGSTTTSQLHGDPEAAAWAVNVAIVAAGTAGYRIRASGDVSTTIYWAMHVVSQVEVSG